MEVDEPRENRMKIVLLFVTIGYSIPCYIFHLLTIYILCAHRFRHRFQYSFYTLFKIQCVLDVCFQVINAVMFRLPYSTLANKLLTDVASIRRGAVPTVGHFLYYYLFYANTFSIALVSSNRIVIMVLPKRVHEGWNRVLPYLLIALFVIPIALTWHIPIGGSFFVESEDAFTPDHNKVFGIRNSQYTFFLHTIIDTFVLIVNLIIIGFIVKNRKKGINWPEIKLFMLTVFNFACQCVRDVFQFLAYSQLCETCYATIFLVHPFMIDAATLLNPWFLLATSMAFRKSVKELLPFKYSGAKRVSVVPTI
ncbi:hypothetical protein QR680_014354 [Steinernema hermaphroditum]|uniref:Serpentine receptor class gamma n=1 Tax=Steinernema hermaphroditum TaxID=289476 RepID=A0AA39IAW6_9BILA|nr:hypothetical protein QR680_014354 [Steinernema hermaphroditum]